MLQDQRSSKTDQGQRQKQKDPGATLESSHDKLVDLEGVLGYVNQLLLLWLPVLHLLSNLT